MKLLYLNNYNYVRGGSEKVLFEEKRLFSSAKHETAVFSRRHELNLVSEHDSCFPAQFSTDRLNMQLSSLKLVSEMIYSRASRRGIKSLLTQYKPDIAHAHNIYGRLTTSVLDELKAFGVPCILTLHDYKLICPNYLMLNHGQICEKCKDRKFRKAIFSKCHKGSYLASAVYSFESWFTHTFQKYSSVNYFVSPSLFLRSKCIEFGWPADKIIHVPNFIDTNQLERSTQAGEYLLYLGRLSHEKGVKTLILALSGLKFKIPLVVVGDGPERQQLEQLANKLQLDVHFSGYLSGSDLKEAIANSKAVVMPSEWYENAPLSLLESFGYGKPVIGARIGGIPEMIDDGVNGYLFEPGNVADLQAKLETMLGNSQQKILEMGKAAREKVERDYSAAAHYGKLMQVYSMALGRPCV